MNLGLEGKVALVTAASQGLGRAYAEALAREGARVVMNARRPDTLARAAQAVRPLMAPGADVHTIAGDVSRPEDISRLVKAAIARFGQLDILVTNSGGPKPGTFAATDDAAWQDALDGTLWPVVHLIRQCLPHLQEAKTRGGGRIINIVSTSVKQPITGLLLSNAVRPAVSRIGAYAGERAGHRRHFGQQCLPRLLRYRSHSACLRSPCRSEQEHHRRGSGAGAKAIPLGRLGDPAELGHVVAFLASDKASYLTGQTISVDGGLVNSLFG